MTNDQKISTIAKLLREMSEEFGERFAVSYFRADNIIPEGRFCVSIGDTHAPDRDPCLALTKALADRERDAADRKLRAEIEAEFKARKAA